MTRYNGRLYIASRWRPWKHQKAISKQKCMQISFKILKNHLNHLSLCQLFFEKGKMLTATVPFKPRCHDSSYLITIEFYISSSKITLLFCYSWVKEHNRCSGQKFKTHLIAIIITYFFLYPCLDIFKILTYFSLHSSSFLQISIMCPLCAHPDMSCRANKIEGGRVSFWILFSIHKYLSAEFIFIYYKCRVMIFAIIISKEMERTGKCNKSIYFPSQDLLSPGQPIIFVYQTYSHHSPLGHSGCSHAC